MTENIFKNDVNLAFRQCRDELRKRHSERRVERGSHEESLQAGA